MIGMEALYVLEGLYLLWLLMSFKTSRPDGTYIKTHPYRRMMFSSSRRETSRWSTDDYVRRDPPDLDSRGPREDSLRHHPRRCDGVCARDSGQSEARPLHLGRRLYQRKETQVSFSERKSSAVRPKSRS